MEKDLCSTCQEIGAAFAEFSMPERSLREPFRQKMLDIVDRIYPQGRSLVSLKRKIRNAGSGPEIDTIADSPEFLRVLLREYRARVKNNKALDLLTGALPATPPGWNDVPMAYREDPQSDKAVSKLIKALLEPAGDTNIKEDSPQYDCGTKTLWPYALDAFKAVALIDYDDYPHLTMIINRLPYSAYTDQFHKGLAGKWPMAGKGNKFISIPMAARMICNSWEFGALLRLSTGQITEAEKQATGYQFPDMAAEKYPERCQEVVGKLVQFWKSQVFNHQQKK